MAASMKTMNIVMPIMSVVICISLPAGVGLYWVASSVVGMVLRLCVNKYMDKLDMNEVMKKNLEKQNKKRAKKGLPPIKENANINTRKNMNKQSVRLKKKKRKNTSLRSRLPNRTAPSTMRKEGSSQAVLLPRPEW